MPDCPLRFCACATSVRTATTFLSSLVPYWTATFSNLAEDAFTPFVSQAIHRSSESSPMRASWEMNS
jgi:hypothetical protein